MASPHPHSTTAEGLDFSNLIRSGQLGSFYTFTLSRCLVWPVLETKSTRDMWETINDRNTQMVVFLKKIVTHTSKSSMKWNPRSYPQRDFAPAVGVSTPKVLERTRGRLGLRLQSSGYVSLRSCQWKKETAKIELDMMKKPYSKLWFQTNQMGSFCQSNWNTFPKQSWNLTRSWNHRRRPCLICSKRSEDLPLRPQQPLAKSGRSVAPGKCRNVSSKTLTSCPGSRGWSKARWEQRRNPCLNEFCWLEWPFGKRLKTRNG